MNKLLTIAFIMSLFQGCASLSEEGEKVEFIWVGGSAREIKKEHKKLKKDKCRFIKKVEASIAAGDTPVGERLLIGLKNEVAENGGNAVISTLKTHGFPMKTYGLAYKCPLDASIDTNI